MSGDLSTFGGLKTALADYSGRAGNATWLANVPLFVRRAHDVLMRDLRIPLLMTTADLTINAERVAVPTGFRAVERLYIDSDTDQPLSPASVEQRVIYAIQYDAAKPIWFSVEGGFLAFAPVPDTSYTGKLLYRKALTFFASDADTNDLLTRYPHAYLFGALAEAARFDLNDESIALYETLFRNEIDAINTSEQADAMAGGTLFPTPSGVVP
jgi:hypothetical protein